MLKLEQVNAYYGRVQALRDISLEVSEGEIVAVIGPNGAGKSTLMNTISGIVSARSGQITFAGVPIAGCRPEQIVRLGLSQVPERRQVFSTMSVADNLVLGAYHRYRHEHKETIAQDMDFVFEIFPRLKDRIKQMAGTLSGGEQQMLALGRAWMAKPKLLLMDEPSLGLAPLLVKEILRVSGELRNQGMTILLVEQNARAALDLADRAYVMESGEVVLAGSAEQLTADARVQTAYLGRKPVSN
ncbi:MAG: ABC transporter ATP-binding protein [Anaerolineae bacterium]|nr:ABC transporter ATP-binding protein [Anaerolineae bacterium]